MDPLPDNFRSFEHAQKDELIVLLHGAVVRLEKRVGELEGQQAKNSSNSSKPSSTDGLDKPAPKPRRNPSGKPSGGQKGHPGSTLKRVTEPDHHLDHEPACCSHCGASLDDAPVVAERRRQVFDLPPVAIEVTEHRAGRCDCFGCGRPLTATFPDEVKASVQYGPTLQAMALYLGKYQLIPYLSLSELFDDIFNCPLSMGTLANFVKRGGAKAAEAVEPIREALREAAVLHADEPSVARYPARDSPNP